MRNTNKLGQAGLATLAVLTAVVLGACSSAQPFESLDGEVVAGEDTVSTVSTSDDEPAPMEVDAGGAETDAAGDGASTTGTEADGSTTLGDGGPSTTVPGWVADGGTAEEVGIQTVYNEVLRTVQAADGAAAVALTSPTTRSWADGVLDLTVNADADRLVNDEPLSTSATVVFLRALLPEAEILAMADGDDLVDAAVDSGVVILLLQGAATGGATSQGELVVEGDEAFNVVDGQRVMRFELVDGQWTFDLSYSLITAFDSAGAGQPEDRLAVLQVLASNFGQGRTWEEIGAPLS